MERINHPTLHAEMDVAMPYVELLIKYKGGDEMAVSELYLYYQNKLGEYLNYLKQYLSGEIKCEKRAEIGSAGLIVQQRLFKLKDLKYEDCPKFEDVETWFYESVGPQIYGDPPRNANVDLSTEDLELMNGECLQIYHLERYSEYEEECWNKFDEFTEIYERTNTLDMLILSNIFFYIAKIRSFAMKKVTMDDFTASVTSSYVQTGATNLIDMMVPLVNGSGEFGIHASIYSLAHGIALIGFPTNISMADGEYHSPVAFVEHDIEHTFEMEDILCDRMDELRGMYKAVTSETLDIRSVELMVAALWSSVHEHGMLPEKRISPNITDQTKTFTYTQASSAFIDYGVSIPKYHDILMEMVVYYTKKYPLGYRMQTILELGDTYLKPMDNGRYEGDTITWSTLLYATSEFINGEGYFAK